MLTRLLRAVIIYLSKAKWAYRIISGWSFAWNVASRFVAGETRAEAVKIVRSLNEHNIQASLDFLGENTTDLSGAEQATAEILGLLEDIQAAGIRSNVSLKLSQLGLNLDEAVCRQHLATILEKAEQLGSFIRIDMEDSALTEKTLATYWWARSQGYDHAGIVLQAYLFRTEADLQKVIAGQGRVRLCKGAYKEPAAISFKHKADTDKNYDRLALQLLEGAREAGYLPLASDGKVPPLAAFATHDAKRIEAVQRAVTRQSFPKEALEFQMLYGIRRDLQASLAQQGFPVRVYVPYGTHWYSYLMRRLAEHPANVWFFVSNFFKR